MEMDEERKARQEKMAATKRFRLAREKDEERKARLETEEEKKRNGFDLDLIWIEIGFYGMSSLTL